MPSPTPLLSILIPSIPERYDAAIDLLRDLWTQATADGGPSSRVEVLVLTDNLTRSIGLKRQALLEASRGAYVAFVDDDDRVAGRYIERLYAGALFAVDTAKAAPSDPLVDVLVFDQEVDYTADDGKRTICRINVALGYPNQELRTDGLATLRKPWHTCAWRRDLAMTSRYPDLSYAEDAAYLRPFWDRSSELRELRVSDGPLYTYTVTPGGSRARLEKP